MAHVLELTVNGQSRVVTLDGNPGFHAEAATLTVVLQALQLKPDRIAVEQNGRIVRRSAWAETRVQSGDKLEIVHFVGGG